MKFKLAVVFIILMHSFTGFSQSITSGLLERSQIDEKYKWDTRDIYENKQEWENDYKWIENNLFLYDEFKGKLDSSANELFNCLKIDDEIKEKLAYLWLYSKLHRDVEMNNESFQNMWGRYSLLETKVEVARSFIKPEIFQIPEKTLQQFIDTYDGLEKYKHFFASLSKHKSHTLSEKREKELSQVNRLVENPYGVFGSLVYAELPFPIIKNDKEEDIQLNRSTSWRARSSQDRKYRKRAYEEYYKSLGTYEKTLTKNLNGLIDGKVYLADSRNYTSALESSLDKNNIPVQVYENLIESVRNNLQPMHRWMKLKKELLKLDSLYVYDTRVSVFKEIKNEYTWEEAYDLTMISLASLGKDYLKHIENAYNNRWIDAYPNVGKETGGYSSGPAGPHPYVKMNWGGQMLDFYTLVHELGHYVHATKLMEKQPYIYQNYPSFLAEVASTTAENISQFYMIKTAKSIEERLYQIEQYLDNAIMLVYTSAMMAEFELFMYQEVENGKPLAVNDLKEKYGKLLLAYYGDEIIITEIDKNAWLEYPHYYLDFYLYSYATSFAVSVQIASDIINEGESGVERFNDFLEAGSSDFPVEVIKKAGVDITNSLPYEAVSNKMNEFMDEIEKFLKN